MNSACLQTIFFLTPRPPFRLDLTVWALRRRPDNAIDCWEDGIYRRTLSTSNGLAEVLVRQICSGARPRLRVHLRGVRRTDAVQAEISSTLTRILGLDVDLHPFCLVAAQWPKLNDLARRFKGMKPPRFASTFDSVVNAIACQQLTLTVGIQLLNKLARTCGGVCNAAGAVPAMPGPRELAGVATHALRDLGFSHRKAGYLTKLAQEVLAGRVRLDAADAMSDAAAVAYLTEIHGIGRWTAEYVLLRGLGRTHIFPGDDVGARNNLQKWMCLSDPLDYQGVESVLAAWRPFAGLIYLHLLLQSQSEAGWI